MAGLHRPICRDKETVKYATIKACGFHDLRAKAITDAKKQGHDPQALAGHDTEALTVRYLRDKEIPLVNGPKFKR